MKGYKDSTKTTWLSGGPKGGMRGAAAERSAMKCFKSGGEVLSAKDRDELSKSDFGLPGSRKYPMPDKSHAANAKARATQMVNAGKLSESSKAKIDAKANKVLKKAEGGRIEKPKTRVDAYKQGYDEGSRLEGEQRRLAASQASKNDSASDIAAYNAGRRDGAKASEGNRSAQRGYAQGGRIVPNYGKPNPEDTPAPTGKTPGRMVPNYGKPSGGVTRAVVRDRGPLIKSR